MTTSPGRREAALEQAAELFATKGVGGTTVRDIGEAAGMLPGSLYHHFRSKDEIVREILRDFMELIHVRLSEAVSPSRDALDNLRALVSTTVRLVADQPHATAIYQNDLQYLRDHGLLAQVDEVADMVRGLWLDVIAQGVQEGSLRSDVPAQVIYRVMRDGLWGTHRWPDRGAQPVEEVADHLLAVFLDGARGARADRRQRSGPSAVDREQSEVGGPGRDSRQHQPGDDHPPES